MRPSRVSFTFLGNFIITVFLLQWWQAAAYPVYVWLMLLLTAAVSGIGILAGRTRNIAIAVLSAMPGILIGFGSVARTTHTTNIQTVDFYASGSKLSVLGTIADQPDKRPTVTKYTIAAESITISGSTFPVRGNVLINDGNQWPEYHYGDKIEAYGKLEKPGLIEDFSYDNYLSRFNIYSVMYRAHVGLTHEGNHLNIFRFLYGWKDSFEDRINRLMPEPQAAFLAGILTGSRRGIPQHLTTDFNTTGLTHIIAISGYNITIVITLITGMFFWLPLRWRFYPAVGCIVLFTLFTGASAAVVRAAIMGILGLIALQSGRLQDTRLTVLWTLFFMIAWNPKYLWYDAGFQLSFLALIGLMELTPVLEPLMKKLPDTCGIRESLTATTAAQIATAPCIIFLFGRFSLIAPVANLLTAPLVPLSMFFGFTAVCLSVIWFPLGLLAGFLAWCCLESIILITSTLAAIPFASVEMGKVSGLMTGFLYGGIIGGYVWLTRRYGFKHQHKL
ncbi:MAG: competence protein ComEC [Candidatus Peribacteria bacterium]|nr:competence protein ComEC [Candidatus Peribacteria bacterium]